MNIGTVARASGVPAKTIRYYENIGLIPPPARSDNGYRRYDDRDVQVLRFVQRARHLGFSIAEVQALLALWYDQDRASREVRDLALAHIEEVDRRIAALKGMRKTLSHLVHECHGDNRPDCPILDELSSQEEMPEH